MISGFIQILPFPDRIIGTGAKTSVHVVIGGKSSRSLRSRPNRLSSPVDRAWVDRTLAPLIRWLRLDRMEDPASDLDEARRALARAGLQQIDADNTLADLTMRELYGLRVLETLSAGGAERLRGHRSLGLAVVRAHRRALRLMRDEQRIDTDAYCLLQEEIDWRELTLVPDHERRIDEI